MSGRGTLDALVTEDYIVADLIVIGPGEDASCEQMDVLDLSRPGRWNRGRPCLKANPKDGQRRTTRHFQGIRCRGGDRAHCGTTMIR